MGLMDDRRRIIAAQPHLVTAAGDTLTCVIAEPKIERLAVAFTCTQTGSGTALPSNIRPIVGWSAVPASIGSQTVTASLGGTYYGGTVDLVSGAMMVTRASIFDQPYTLAYGQHKNDWVQCNIRPSNLFAPGTFLLSDRFSTAAASGTVGRLSWYNGLIYFNCAASEFTSFDQAGAEAWLATYKPQFVAAYASPQTIQLTAQTINAVRGAQTVSSTAGAVGIAYWTK